MKYLVQLLLRCVDVWKVGVTEEFFYATKLHFLEKFLKKSSKLSVGLDGLRDCTVRPPDTSRKIESALQIPVGK